MMKPRLASIVLGVVWAAAVVACSHRTRAPSRDQPVCATQDCNTGQITDDGCASDGRRESCVNMCPAPPAASAPH